MMDSKHFDVDGLYRGPEGPPETEVARFHRLKTWALFFQSVVSGEKPFEVRRNDRDFWVGDFLVLEEYHPLTEDYTGAYWVGQVTYALTGEDFGIVPGFVVMGLRFVQYGYGFTPERLPLAVEVLPTPVAEGAAGR